jgi:hypothetical protein
MIYGPFSLVNATAAELDFKLWINSELSYDGVCRMASIDGSSFSGTCTTGNSSGWIDKTLDLTNVYSLGDLRGQPQGLTANQLDVINSQIVEETHQATIRR